MGSRCAGLMLVLLAWPGRAPAEDAKEARPSAHPPEEQTGYFREFRKLLKERSAGEVEADRDGNAIRLEKASAALRTFLDRRIEARNWIGQILEVSSSRVGIRLTRYLEPVPAGLAAEATLRLPEDAARRTAIESLLPTLRRRARVRFTASEVRMNWPGAGARLFAEGTLESIELLAHGLTLAEAKAREESARRLFPDAEAGLEEAASLLRGEARSFPFLREGIESSVKALLDVVSDIESLAGPWPPAGAPRESDPLRGAEEMIEADEEARRELGPGATPLEIELRAYARRFAETSVHAFDAARVGNDDHFADWYEQAQFEPEALARIAAKLGDVRARLKSAADLEPHRETLRAALRIELLEPGEGHLLAGNTLRVRGRVVYPYGQPSVRVIVEDGDRTFRARGELDAFLRVGADGEFSESFEILLAGPFTVRVLAFERRTGVDAGIERTVRRR